MSLVLDDLLDQSAAFDRDLHDLLTDAENNGSPRSILLVSMCDLVFEHGRSVQMLVERGHLASAIALLRVQLDAIIRIVWIHYAATDDWVQSVVALQPGGLSKDPTNALSVNDMLRGIQAKAPAELHRQLAEFKTAAWPALNSYIHSGIWPVVQRMRGNEIEGAIQTLKNSNGLSGMSAMMVAMHTGNRQNTIGVKLLHLRHKGCLPPLREEEGSRQGA